MGTLFAHWLQCPVPSCPQCMSLLILSECTGTHQCPGYSCAGRMHGCIYMIQATMGSMGLPEPQIPPGARAQSLVLEAALQLANLGDSQRNCDLVGVGVQGETPVALPKQGTYLPAA